MGPFRNHCSDSDSAYAILLSKPARGTDESRLTIVGCCNSAAFLPPSPPGEKATAPQDQAGETGTDKGGRGVVPTSVPAPYCGAWI
jgi:hypothetical protein